MALNSYLQQTQRFLGDPTQSRFNLDDLKIYINRARREVAMRGECIRILAPITGSIVRAHVTNSGNGYSQATTKVTISAPDFPDTGSVPYPNGLQATAVPVVQAGKVVDIEITLGGFGYFQPIATISDPTGTGATATLETNKLSVTQGGQEVYRFADVDLSTIPGARAIYSVRSVSIVYANYRYSLPTYSFSTYQSAIRNYPFQYQYVPTIAAQRGRGTAGSLYLYPIASTFYQMDWDAFALPNDLTTDYDTEAIPEPYTDIVPYFAAHLAFIEAQDLNKARAMLDLFDTFSRRHGLYTLPGRITSPYGRW